MKDTFYFSHDYNPTADPKIQALIGEHGAIGYGIYWRLVEMLHESELHKLELKKYIFIAISKQMLTSVEQVSTIVDDCINSYELFVSEGNFFFSERVNRNIEKRSELSQLRSKSGKISAEKRRQQVSTSVEQVSTSVEQNVTKERKGEERKEKEIASEQPQNFTSKSEPPSLDEVIEFFKSYGFAKSGAEKFWNHYQLAQPKTWCDVGGNSIIPFWKQNAHSKWFEKSEKIPVYKNSSNILR